MIGIEFDYAIPCNLSGDQWKNIPSGHPLSRHRVQTIIDGIPHIAHQTQRTDIHAQGFNPTKRTGNNRRPIEETLDQLFVGVSILGSDRHFKPMVASALEHLGAPHYVRCLNYSSIEDHADKALPRVLEAFAESKATGGLSLVTPLGVPVEARGDNGRAVPRKWTTNPSVLLPVMGYHSGDHHTALGYRVSLARPDSHS